MLKDIHIYTYIYNQAFVPLMEKLEPLYKASALLKGALKLYNRY